MTLRLGELCAGYGGLGMAVEEVFGATTAWFSEFDAAPSKILAHHWPDVPNYGDMTKIDWAAIEPVDIISGGTPCQDLSAAGRRRGMTEGTRSNLWVQMREAIAIQRPKYVVWENVRGAYSATAASDLEQCPGCMGDAADGGAVLRALGRVLGDLSDLGFHAEWRGLRAADVGACHSRFRVFILARRQATDDARSTRGQESDNASEPTPQRPGASGLAYESDQGRIRCQPPAHPERLHSERRGIHGDVACPSGAGQAHGGEREWHGDAANDSNPAHRTGAINWGEYEPAVARWERVNGPAPRPTEPTGRDNAHRLSPAFVEWMMGLPAGWVTDVPGVNRNAQLKALGNGVVPQQAMAALRDMLAAYEMDAAA